MQAQHHHAGKQAQAPPRRHLDPQGGGQKSVGRPGDGVGVEQVLPHHGQGPLGHDVGEDEDGAEIFAPGHIRPGHQECEQAAEEDGHHTGPHRQQQSVQKRRPQVGHRQPAGEQVDIVDQGISLRPPGQIGVDGARVDLEGVLHDGHNRCHSGDGEHNAHQQQDHIVGLGEKGFDPVAPDRGPAGPERRCLIHKVLLFLKWSSAPGGGPPLGSKGACSDFTQGRQRPGSDQLAVYLSSISIQLPTVKATEAQYSGSSSTSLPSVVHQS